MPLKGLWFVPKEPEATACSYFPYPSQDILQPIAVSPPQGEVGEEADTEETPQRKSKKHRDRADGSRKKRRHKSRHSAKEGDDHNL